MLNTNAQTINQQWINNKKPDLDDLIGFQENGEQYLIDINRKTKETWPEII